MALWTFVIGVGVILTLLSGIRIVRPTHKLVVETLGKYSYTAEQGFKWLVPIIQSGHYVNITEQMIDTREQTVITKDNLNAKVDAVIYYKILHVEDSLYKVNDHKTQLGSLTRTTLRNVIGNMTFSDANSKRDNINASVETVLNKETKTYGVDVLRVELQKVEAPEDIQEAMNEVVKAERQKIAAKDFANANVIEAEGYKRAHIERANGEKQASILKAQGDKESNILKAQGKSKAIELENLAADKYFVGNAPLLKKLEVTADSMRNNSKIVVPTDTELINVIGDMAGVPIIPKPKKEKK